MSNSICKCLQPCSSFDANCSDTARQKDYQIYFPNLYSLTFNKLQLIQLHSLQPVRGRVKLASWSGAVGKEGSISVNYDSLNVILLSKLVFISKPSTDSRKLSTLSCGSNLNTHVLTWYGSTRQEKLQRSFDKHNTAVK